MVKTIAVVSFAGLALALGGRGLTSQCHTELNYGSVATEAIAFDQFGVGMLTPSADRAGVRVSKRPVSFSQVAALAAEHLVDKVGQSGKEISDQDPPALADARDR